MPLVLAYQCPVSKKLYENAELYKRVLCRKNYKRFINNRRERIAAEIESRLAEMRRLSDFEDIAQWLMDNAKVLRAHNSDRENILRKTEPFSLTEVEFRNMRWSSAISITHNAPLGQQTNFFRDPSRPTHFPGFVGTLRFALRGYGDFSSNLFKNTGICMGSGSGGSKYYTGEVYLFDADWPILAMKRELCR